MLMKQFEQTGCMMDNKKGIVGRKKSVRTPENNARVQEISTLTTVQQDLKMSPYKI
jgi:hypothetical protein